MLKTKTDIFSILKRAGIDGFQLAIIVAVIAAWLLPQPGIAKGSFSLEALSSHGLSFIFFFYGLKLSLHKLRSELVNWRMHMIVHLSTFVLFPLIGLLIMPLFRGESHIVWLGIFYLCALPSTVSSSVVMVSIAGGNLPAAIFNASLSTLAGIFITPLWMLPVLEAGGGSLHPGDIMLKLFLQVLLPVTIGLLLNQKLGWFADKYKKQLRFFDQGVIVLIIYTAFCHAFYEKAFAGFSLYTILMIAAGMSALFFLVLMLLKKLCGVLKFNRRDSITVLFCGSKKSLVHGTVMSKVLFPASAEVSVILLPLMIYHALQLIFVSVIAQKMANPEKLKNLPSGIKQ
ncbi:MAG: bile acid:sodium symporter [Chitinophagaceae bacterium]|nr:bile acid:sodium symporter [Chitinophagaceae bacterium]